MTDEQHDFSRVDSYLRSRHRVEVMSAMWRPMAAGGLGAVAVIGTVALGAWLVGPRYRYNEIEIPRVIVKNTPFDNYVPHTKPFDNYAPHERGSVAPSARAPAASPLAPRSSAERRLEGSGPWGSSDIRGRIVRENANGFDLATDRGERPFFPAKIGADGKPVLDESVKDRVAGLIGSLAYCRPLPAGTYECRALRRDGREIEIEQVPIGGAAASPTPSTSDMVSVNVDIGGRSVKAMVDTGSGWPMSLPKSLADELVQSGRATRVGASTTTHADGSQHAVDLIMIKMITVDGRVLRDVEASVSPSDKAPILLGLGALNRLGRFSISNGRISFS